MVKSGITRDELIEWGGAEVFNQALAVANSGDVKSASYDDDTLTISGKVDICHSGYDTTVTITLQPGGRIMSHCPCERNRRYGQICPHVVALGLRQLVNEMEDAEAENKASGQKGAEESESAEREPDNIEVPMKPKFYAYVSGTRASLSIELDACYGDIDFPACSMQADRTVWLEDPDDPLVRRTRSPEAEHAAVASLEKWGFEKGYQEGDLKVYLTDQQKLLNFLGAGLPALRRRPGWRVELSERLGKLVDSFGTVAPLVEIKDAPNGAFDVAYSFTAISEQGSSEVSPIEVQAALNRGDGYILRDGQVTLLDNAAIEAMHEVFRDCATSQDGAAAGWFRVRSVHAPYVKSSLDDLGIEFDDAAAARWRANAEERNRTASADAKFEPVALGRLEGVLRPYQKQGVYWMRFLENAGLSGLLADEMGLGKTLQTLTWLSLPRVGNQGRDRAPRDPRSARRADPTVTTVTTDNQQPATNNQQPATNNQQPSLIICPTSLVRNWEAEAKKFTPWLNTLVISGPDRADDFAKIPEADLVITSYALVQRDFEAAYMDTEFAVVVLDEAQHIKNRQTKNARAVKLVPARQRLVLTGTPVENSVADVWSIFDFLMPEYLGEYEAFRVGYEDPIAAGGSSAEEAQARLRRKLKPFILRRLKKSVAKDLPDKIVKVSYCPMSDEAQNEYNAVLAKTRREAGAIVKAKGFEKSRFELLALLMKLRQIASRSKVEAFMEQLADAIAGGHKILVFSQFVKMLTVLREALDAAGVKYCYLDGSTKDRLGECNRFNRSPEIPVFLISLMAGGTGLNLTGADMVIHYDPWWNPAVEDQATDRAHRIGQKKTVYVMKMIASGSVEEKVLALQRRKQAVIAATVDTTDSAVMEKLTAADIAELLA